MFLVVLRQTVIFGILMIVGAISRRTGILNDEREKGLSVILINVVTPCVIIGNLGRAGMEEYRKGLFLAVIISILVYAVYFIVMPLLVPESDEYDYPVVRFACTYPNCGYMGIPLVQSLLGEEGVVYVVAAITVFNLLTFTQGVNSYKQEKETFDPKIFLQPAIISVAIGLVFFLTPLSLPSILADSMDMISSLNTPLPMLIVGSSLVKIDYKNISHKGRIALATVYRLLLLPLVAIAFCMIVPADMTVKLTTIIIFACPAANLALIFGIQHGRDTLLASELIAVTTILSIVTIPIITWIGQALLQ